MLGDVQVREVEKGAGGGECVFVFFDRSAGLTFANVERCRSSGGQSEQFGCWSVDAVRRAIRIVLIKTVWFVLKRTCVVGVFQVEIGQGLSDGVVHFVDGVGVDDDWRLVDDRSVFVFLVLSRGRRNLLRSLVDFVCSDGKDESVVDLVEEVLEFVCFLRISACDFGCFC